jgi:type I restriction enzyme M protein
LADKRAIAQHVNTHPGVTQRQTEFMDALETWWQQHLPIVEALAPDADNQHATGRNVYAVRATLLDSIERTFAGQNHLLLNRYQVRGAFANYYKLLASDFKSIAFSGWGAELIPDTEILQSQFPEVLAEMEKNRLRLAELAALLAAADEEEYEDSDDTGVLPGDEVKRLKAELKEANAQAKLARKEKRDDKKFLATATEIETRLARHKALEDEAKSLKALIKATEKSRDELVEKARQNISKDEARVVIVERLGKVLFESYRQYLRADQRACIAAIENLWGKYAVTAKQIEAEREEA